METVFAVLLPRDMALTKETTQEQTIKDWENKCKRLELELEEQIFDKNMFQRETLEVTRELAQIQQTRRSDTEEIIQIKKKNLELQTENRSLRKELGRKRKRLESEIKAVTQWKEESLDWKLRCKEIQTKYRLNVKTIRYKRKQVRALGYALWKEKRKMNGLIDELHDDKKVGQEESWNPTLSVLAWISTGNLLANASFLSWTLLFIQPHLGRLVLRWSSDKGNKLLVERETHYQEVLEFTKMESIQQHFVNLMPLLNQPHSEVVWEFAIIDTDSTIKCGSCHATELKSFNFYQNFINCLASPPEFRDGVLWYGMS